MGSVNEQRGISRRMERWVLWCNRGSLVHLKKLWKRPPSHFNL